MVDEEIIEALGNEPLLELACDRIIAAGVAYENRRHKALPGIIVLLSKFLVRPEMRKARG